MCEHRRQVTSVPSCWKPVMCAPVTSTSSSGSSATIPICPQLGHFNCVVMAKGLAIRCRSVSAEPTYYQRHGRAVTDMVRSVEAEPLLQEAEAPGRVHGGDQEKEQQIERPDRPLLRVGIGQRTLRALGK